MIRPLTVMVTATVRLERKAEFKSSPSTSLPIEEAGWFQ